MEKYINYIRGFFFRLFYFAKSKGKIKGSLLQRVCNNVHFDIRKNSTLTIGEKNYFQRNCEIRSFNGGYLEFGKGCTFNVNCYIASCEKISIGKNVIVGPNTIIVDHNHDFRCKEGIKALKYKSKPVFIGEDVWIGGNVTILAGSSIGHNSVIGANCVIHGDYPPYSIVSVNQDLKVRCYLPE